MVDFGTVFSLAITFFIIWNALGNAPAVLTMIKDFSFQRQRAIVIREGFISLILALFFQFFGEWFLQLLDLKDYTVAFCGGLLLLVIAYTLIFPRKNTAESAELTKEPFIVPIAIPLLTGPAMIGTILLKAREVPGFLTLSLGIFIAWLGVMAVLLFTPYIVKVFGPRGTVALEQLMGMILAMISMEMLLNGISLFIIAYNQA